MKVRVILKGGCGNIDIEMPDKDFNFGSLVMNVRGHGFIQADNVHIPYDSIAAILTGNMEMLTTPEPTQTRN